MLRKTTVALSVRPIGIVRNQVKEPIHEGWDEILSELHIEEPYEAGLEGIEGFSHVIVLFWLHRVDAEHRDWIRTHPQIHPRDRQDLPLVGILATRTQYRPNPIGVTSVRLVERRGRVLRVQGLDAIDGTPILDVKPYVPHYDAHPEALLPEWATRH